MKLRLPMLFVALFAFTMTAWAQVDVVWDRTGAELPSWFGANTERGMAYGEVGGEARIYVVSYAGGEPNVYIINPETGADVGTLDNTDIEGGFFGLILTDIGVSDDGVIFASNTASMDDGNLKVYRWDSEISEPEVVIDFDALAEGRLGDRISVFGSADDNSLEIWAGVARSNQVVRFTTNDNGHSFDHEVITLQGVTDSGIQPSIHLRSDGTFLFNAARFDGEAGVNPMHFESDGTLIAEVSGDWLATNTIKSYELDDREIMATFYGIDEGSQTVAFFDITDGLDNAQYLMSTPSLGMMANLFAAGDFDVSFDDEGEATIYVMAMNHGLRAFHAASIEATLEGTYYVGAEGTAPDGADPDYASLGDAFAAINGASLSGSVTLLVTSDIDERGQNVVLNTDATSEDVQIEIRPAPGVDATITLGAIADVNVDVNNSGLAIDNTSWVTIDGSNGDDESRNLTFVLEDNGGTRVLSVVRGSHHVAIRNVNVQREAYHASSEGVRVRRAQDETTGLVPDQVVIENNVIGTAEVPLKDGVGLFGTLGLSVGTTHVLNNTIWAGHRGITTFYNAEEQVYSHNTIHITGHQNNPAWYGAIYLAAVENARIEGNEIVLGGTNFSADGRYTAGFVLNVNIGDLILANNTISTAGDFEIHGSSDDFGIYGIASHRGTGDERYHVLHNSVRLGETDATGLVAAVGHPEDAVNFTTTSKNFVFRNNIFVVEADGGYAFNWRVTSTGSFSSDYNNLYAPDGIVGDWIGEDLAGLAAWQFTSGQDANSVSVDVEFVSETDLRLTGGSIQDESLAGTGVAMVTVDIDGNPRNENRPYMGAFEGPVWVGTEDAPVAEIPGGFELHQNYPNPFNPSTTISYTLSQGADVTVRVYDVSGRLVGELVNQYQPQGRHEVRFDANHLASGVYIYRVQVGDQVQTRQMVFVK